MPTSPEAKEAEEAWLRRAAERLLESRLGRPTAVDRTREDNGSGAWRFYNEWAGLVVLSGAGAESPLGAKPYAVDAEDLRTALLSHWSEEPPIPLYPAFRD